MSRPLRKDLTGVRVGKLNVVSFSHVDKSKRAHWVCQCDCGNRCVVRSNHLLGKYLTRSCGCLSSRLIKTPEWIKKISDIKKGIASKRSGWKHTEATKKLIQQALKGRRLSSGMTGKHHKRESIEKGQATKIRLYGNPLAPSKNTKAEIAVDGWLKSLGISYVKQHPINGYVADFYIPELKLVVEVDGCYWHNCPKHFPEVPRPKALEHDRVRDDSFRNSGYLVLRIWEHDISLIPDFSIRSTVTV